MSPHRAHNKGARSRTGGRALLLRGRWCREPCASPPRCPAKGSLNPGEAKARRNSSKEAPPPLPPRVQKTRPFLTSPARSIFLRDARKKSRQSRRGPAASEEKRRGAWPSGANCRRASGTSGDLLLRGVLSPRSERGRAAVLPKTARHTSLEKRYAWWRGREETVFWRGGLLCWHRSTRRWCWPGGSGGPCATPPRCARASCCCAPCFERKGHSGRRNLREAGICCAVCLPVVAGRKSSYAALDFRPAAEWPGLSAHFAHRN